MRFSLLTLALLAPCARADDPPYLEAAKERQRNAKAFEVALTIQFEWKNVKRFNSSERRDFAGTGTATLAVDGDKFRWFVDVPMLTENKDGVSRRRFEMAFDGTQTFTREDILVEKGERAGQFYTWHGVTSSREKFTGWDAVREPIYWALRGGSPGSLLAELDEQAIRDGWSQTIQPTGRDEVIDGHRCIEIEQVTTSEHNVSKSSLKNSFWLDTEAGYVPKRVDRTVVGYVPHPVCGWRPSGWTISFTDPRKDETTITTVNVDSFELPASIPEARFTIVWQPGTRVTRGKGVHTEFLVVTEDGSLVPAEQPAALAPAPRFELPSLGRTLAVVGGTVALFAGFVVLLKRLVRTRTGEMSDSGNSPHLPT